MAEGAGHHLETAIVLYGFGFGFCVAAFFGASPQGLRMQAPGA